jgi:hypothetical protein
VLGVIDSCRSWHVLYIWSGMKKSEGVFVPWAQGVSRDEFGKYLNLLLKVLLEKDLSRTPSCISNIEATLPRPGAAKRIILSENDLPESVHDAGDDDVSLNEDECAEWLESYCKTETSSNWIHCVVCREQAATRVSWQPSFSRKVQTSRTGLLAFKFAGCLCLFH